MQLIQTILDDPVLVAVVVLAVRAVLAYQRGLTYAEYRPIHAFKRRVFPRLGAPFIHTKGGRDDAEFLRTVNGTPKDVFETLRAGGGSPHIICSVKRRRTEGDLSRAHVVWRHGDGTQTEAFCFASGGEVDVYCHHEPSVLHPVQHLNGKNQTAGDPRGVVSDALDASE